MGDLCQTPEFRCARWHVFRPLDDRFVRGDGRSGRPIDQRGDFSRFGRFNGASGWAKGGFILSLGNMAQWSAISIEGAMANVFQLHAGTT